MPTSDSICSSYAHNDIKMSHDVDTTRFSSIVVVAGAARSGTSWLGQIFDSSPDVAYRFQPFFSYAFRGFVEFDSSKERWKDFFQQLYTSQDPFLLQTDKRKSGEYPTFAKRESPRSLVIKTCRFQYLLSPLLHKLDNAKLVGIVRHPGGALASWLTNPKEFPPGAALEQEWRFGGCKNQGLESEFFGYYKWKEIAHLYWDLRDQFPDRVRIVRYENLVDHPQEEARNLFDFAGLPWSQATEDFLAQCHSTHQVSTYSVFKDRSVRDQWRTKLPRTIQEAIQQDLQGTRLEEFIR
jgi:Sulfotransferase family